VDLKVEKGTKILT